MFYVDKTHMVYKRSHRKQQAHNRQNPKLLVKRNSHMLLGEEQPDYGTQLSC